MCDLVPVIGGILPKIADRIDKKIKLDVAKKIAGRLTKTVNSFYHKEIESEAEYVCVSFLYTYEMTVKERIMAKRNHPEE